MEIKETGAKYSSIVGIGEKIKELEKTNGKYLYLNRGLNQVVNIDLSQMNIDLNTNQIQHYPPNSGFAFLKSAINRDYFNGNTDDKNIYITNGGMSALDLIFKTLKINKIFTNKFYWGAYVNIMKINGLGHDYYENLDGIEDKLKEYEGNAVIICDPLMENITFGAYGDESLPRPKIIGFHRDGIIACGHGDNLIIENLHIIGESMTASEEGVPQGSAGCIHLGASNNVIIRNCEIERAFNGIRKMPYGKGQSAGLLVENCHVHDIMDDGIFIVRTHDVTIRNCHIERTDLEYWTGDQTEGTAPGDSVQLTHQCDNFLIENNIMDKRTAGTKFCFIHNNVYDETNNGKIIGNTFYSPFNRPGFYPSGGAIFLGKGANIEIKNNKFLGDGYGDIHVEFPHYYPTDGNGFWCPTGTTGQTFMFDATGTTTGGVGQIHWTYMDFSYNEMDDHPGVKFVKPKTDYYERVWLKVTNNTMTYKTPNSSEYGMKFSSTIRGEVRNNIVSVIGKNWDDGDIEPIQTVNAGVLEFSNNHETVDDFVSAMFVDWQNADYHLLEGSPLIDAGIYVQNKVDIEGNQIIGKPDIGAYETSFNTEVPPSTTRYYPEDGTSDLYPIVLLEWDKIQDATGYRLNFDGTVTDLGDVTEFQPNALEYGKVYPWTVTPYNDYGDATDVKMQTFTIRDFTEMFTAHLQWNPVEGSNGYLISIGTDDSATNIEYRLDVGDSTTFNLEWCEYETTYYWQIIPYNESGNASDCPIWSFETGEYGILLPPSCTTPVNPEDGETGVKP